MKLHIIMLGLLYVSISHAQTDSSTAPLGSIGTELNNDIPIYNFDSLAPLLQTNSDKTYVVNFWAMWCAPCVKELPIIQEYERNNPDVEVILVSLDFLDNIETKLKPFIRKNGITSKVILLDDPDANRWIDMVDPNWSGSIPFTIIFNNENRSFHERPCEDVGDLENEINKTINTK